ncbi:MAG: flagellar basal body-associated protein FliL [Psychrobium sp.]|nr:flagellar basal body-associated protein FliL [Psychrobium sp.]
MHKILYALIFGVILGFSVPSHSAEGSDYAYFGFEPDIITNYIGTGKKLGFIRITMEIMVKSPDDVAIIEHHAPLLRAAVVEVLGEQSESKIKSIAGKLEIRNLCLDTINKLLKEETGQELAVSLLFTKYIYH